MGRVWILALTPELKKWRAFRPVFLALGGAFQQAEYRGLGGTKPRNKKHTFCKHDQSYINKSSINQSNSINQSSNQSNTIQSNPVQSNPIQSINQSSNQSTITQLSIFDTKSSSSMNWVAALPANCSPVAKGPAAEGVALRIRRPP